MPTAMPSAPAVMRTPEIRQKPRVSGQRVEESHGFRSLRKLVDPKWTPTGRLSSCGPDDSAADLRVYRAGGRIRTDDLLFTRQLLCP
jgi:hypothetical protein